AADTPESAGVAYAVAWVAASWGYAVAWPALAAGVSLSLIFLIWVPPTGASEGSRERPGGHGAPRRPEPGESLAASLPPPTETYGQT
ncbi:MAG: hypothetical protein L3K09_08795, partial [Thermoplasmata archaeon]|nr:hypothetical protein [Thermoplasmata archaeon]